MEYLVANLDCICNAGGASELLLKDILAGQIPSSGILKNESDTIWYHISMAHIAILRALPGKVKF